VLDDRGHEKAAEIRYRAERCGAKSTSNIRRDERKRRGEERKKGCSYLKFEA
jgi:hypothetical protein